MTRVSLSPEAVRDLAQIKSYITNELDNPTAANRVLYGKRDFIKILFKELPEEE